MKHSKQILFIVILFSVVNCLAQFQQIELSDSNAVRVLKGTLLYPETQHAQVPLVIIIAGSGPTDRDGNNPQMKSDYLKFLSEGLTAAGIATFRYDKRGVGKSTVVDKSEASLVIEDFANDAAAWLKVFRDDKRFSKLILLGHSEGSFLGMLAAQVAATDAFISVAGAGRAIHEILKEQIKSNPFNPEYLVKENEVIIDSLKAGYRVKNVSQLLQALYRPSIQPYLISWFKYDPAEELKKLNMPVMIVQGTTDIQVSMQDAERLHEARPDAEYLVVEGMNHVLRDAPAERMANIAVYTQADKPLSSALLPALIDFIKGIK
ncbi:MAG TPA: alpha/beta fold hydrolase [Cyclobacteriaceae bacterium]|nr:alpha/beta fold hydrolase [Cyclobacteriaceae bacterium]